MNIKKYQKSIGLNTGENQKRKNAFLDQHILHNQTALVEVLLEKELCQWEEVRNMTIDHSDLIDRLEAAREKLADAFAECRILNVCEKIMQKEAELQERIDQLEAEQEESIEIAEWCLVDSFLAERLEQEGEAVLDAFDCQWWGRTHSGQSAMLDWVISKICFDLCLLEKQEC